MRKLFSILYPLHFLNDGLRTSIIALLPFIAKDLNLSLTQVGFIGSSQGLMGALLAIPGGLIASKFGGIKLLFLMFIVYSLCLGLIGSSNHSFLLIFAYYLAALGFAPFHTVGQAVAARMSDKSNIGRNISNFAITGESGRLLVPAIALFATSLFGWRSTLLTSAILCLFLFTYFVARWRQNKIHINKHLDQNRIENISEWFSQFLIILMQKKLLFVSLAGFLDNLGSHAIYVFFPFLLLEKGVDKNMLGVFVGAFFLGTFTGKVILGRWVDKYGNINILYVSEVLMALSLFLLTVSNHFILYFIICYFLGVFTRGTTPAIATLFSEIAHKNHYEKVYAIAEIFLAFAAAVSATLMGVISEVYGLSYAFYTSAFLVIISLIPLYFYSKIRNK